MVDQNLLENIDQFIAFVRDRSRLSRIGALVDGVVHNLNGSIQALSMQMEIIQKIVAGRLEKDLPSLQNRIEQCAIQIDKLKAILEGLDLRKNSDEVTAPRGIDLNEVLEREIGVFHHHLFFKHHIKVRKNFSRRLPLINGHETDFNEALSNVIENAAEAMETTPQKDLTLTTRAGHDHIQVVVTDTGCGLPKALWPRLFTPFFTTKSGNHYGLGLFMTRWLLTPYGASIEPHFKEGETFFSVTIPLTPPSTLPKRL